MAQKISELMISHHALIEVLVAVFKDEAAKDGAGAKESFDKLKWELEKHFFIEENALFGFYIKGVHQEMYELVAELENEHKMVRKFLKEMEDGVQEKSENNISVLGNVLVKHREKEEQVLYPKMEKDMSALQKETVIKRINEIPIKGS
mgnify:CR=1 FL=1